MTSARGLSHWRSTSQLSPRELAVRFTDTERYFVSEASVYRLLKALDLITSPAFIVMKAMSHCHRQCKTDPGGDMKLTHRIRWFLLSGGADAEGGGTDGIGSFEEARREHPVVEPVDWPVSEHGSALFAGRRICCHAQASAETGREA
jgi:hypothetical protein